MYLTNILADPNNREAMRLLTAASYRPPVFNYWDVLREPMTTPRVSSSIVPESRVAIGEIKDVGIIIGKREKLSIVASSFDMYFNIDALKGKIESTPEVEAAIGSLEVFLQQHEVKFEAIRQIGSGEFKLMNVELDGRGSDMLDAIQDCVSLTRSKLSYETGGIGNNLRETLRIDSSRGHVNQVVHFADVLSDRLQLWASYGVELKPLLPRDSLSALEFSVVLFPDSESRSALDKMINLLPNHVGNGMSNVRQYGS